MSIPDGFKPNIASAVSPSTFAIRTFLERPIINLIIPSEKSEMVTCLLLIWSWISLYFTIGPATSCGKSEI